MDLETGDPYQFTIPFSIFPKPRRKGTEKRPYRWFRDSQYLLDQRGRIWRFRSGLLVNEDGPSIREMESNEERFTYLV